MRYNEIDHDIISQVIAEDAARRKGSPIPQTTAQMIRRSIAPHSAAEMVATMREDKEGKRIYHFEDGSYLVFAITFTAVEEGVL